MPASTSRTARAIVITAQLLLVGCLGGSDEALSPAATAIPEFSATMGAIAGVITTQAVEPIQGATVTALEVDKNAQATTNGAYTLDLLRPGEYTLTAVAEGYKSVSQVTTVNAGQVTWVNFTLTPGDVTDPYVVEEEFHGYTSCALALMVLLATGGCDDANDKLEYYTKADVDLQSIVGEMAWDTADRLVFIISEHPDPQGDPTGINKRSYGRVTATTGENYLRMHLRTGTLNDDQGGTLPLPPPNATYEYGTRTFYIGNAADESSDAYRQVCTSEPTGLANSTVRGCDRNFGGLGATTAVPYRIILSTFYITPAPQDYALLQP